METISNQSDVLGKAAAWIAEGRDLALATVVKTWGSAPRPAGSQLVIDRDGNFEGSVSGGCVEGAVVGEAADVIDDKKPRLLEFGVADETAWRVGLSCGGKISVYVQPIVRNGQLDPALIADLNRARTERQPMVVTTNLKTGDVGVMREAEIAAPSLAPEVLARVRSGESGIDPNPEGQPVFVAVNLPSPRLVAIGAVHISQALAPMAQLAGLDVTIIDPRTAFASDARFPNVRLFADWPQDVLPTVGLDRFTALAALTHDPKIDDEALVAALAANCFYVGALGSRKTHAARLARLAKRGVSEESMQRLRAPIGLPINAQSPAEIAVAVLGEIIQALRSGAAT